MAILLWQTWGRWDYFAVSLVYGLGLLFLFSASAIYHAKKQKENEINIWRKLDHVAIFIMIAGSYTPVSYAYLGGAWFWSVIIIQWSCVVLGLFFKVFYMKAPRILSPILYMLMGWMAVVPLHIFWDNMPTVVFVLLAAGGLAYSLGAVIYAVKKPNPLPKVFGFHEIFHLLILAGAVLHYLMVYTVVTGV